MTKKAMIAMSGGVDSTVAALLLLERGYQVVGATLKLYNNDVEDAKLMARHLGFEHYVFDFGRYFEENVMEKFSVAYQKGETPNPCINCNRYIKFGKLLEQALLLGSDYIATGHYARIEFDQVKGRYLLKKAFDLSKDQSYVLYALTQKELAKILFPLGDMLKTEVRKIADEHGLINGKKPDSQDICFVDDGDYAGFLRNVMGVKSKPGNFVDSQGKILGRHKGIINYTLGQRRGLNISFGKRMYVTGIDAESDTVILGDEEDLSSSNLIVADVNFISIDKLENPMGVTAKIRYSGDENPGVIYPLENGNVILQFDRPQRAATPGQAAVFYDGDIVIGGGRIVTEK